MCELSKQPKLFRADVVPGRPRVLPGLGGVETGHLSGDIVKIGCTVRTERLYAE